MRIIIIGAGGHAQVVADILLRMSAINQAIQPLGYLDDNPAAVGQIRISLPVLGKTAQLDNFAHDAVIIAIGNNRTRQKIYDQLAANGENFATACHPSAVIAPDVPIGSGTMICAGTIVTPGSIIGNNVILNTGCTVDHHNQIADHAHIAPGSHLGGDVKIATGALIGIGAIVMPQRSVGAWSTVGAASLVHSNVPDGATVIGVPARIVSKRPPNVH